MLVHLRAQSHTALRRLTPVSPMAIVCTVGKMVVKHRGFERSLVPGAQYLARAFESVDLHLNGCGSRATECTLDMTFPSPLSEGGSLGERLARHVFSDPANAWSAAIFSALTGITPLRIRRKLFAEGVAFTEVCRNQRLMRLLFSILSDVGPSRALVRRTGWPEASDVEAHFYDKFGPTIDSACGLVQSRGGWQLQHRASSQHPLLVATGT